MSVKELRPGDVVLRILSPNRMIIVALYGDLAWCTYMKGPKKFTEYHMADALLFKSVL